MHVIRVGQETKLYAIFLGIYRLNVIYGVYLRFWQTLHMMHTMVVRYAGTSTRV